MFKISDDESSWLGRLHALKAARNQVHTSNAGRSAATGLGLLTLGQIGEAAGNRLVGGKLTPEDVVAAKNDRKTRPGKGLVNNILRGAGVGTLAGGLSSAALAASRLGSPLSGLDILAAGLLTGGALGGVRGALTGSGAEATNTIIDDVTSDRTKQLAAERLAKHPYASALPFGDIILAMGDKSYKEKEEQAQKVAAEAFESGFRKKASEAGITNEADVKALLNLI